jgi:hypothetical protein
MILDKDEWFKLVEACASGKQERIRNMDKKIIMALTGMVFVLCDAECVDYGAVFDSGIAGVQAEIDSHAKWKGRTRTETAKHQKWKAAAQRLRTNIDALRAQMGQAPVANWNGLSPDELDAAMQLGDLITIIGDLQGDNDANTQLIADMRGFVARVVNGIRGNVHKVPTPELQRLFNIIADDLDRNLPGNP